MRAKCRYATGWAMISVSFVSVQRADARDIPSPPIEDRAQATECLTLAIAYEAGYEPTEGQEAVAEVVLNRVRSPSFPKTICDVVFAGSKRRTGCQFTFTCDGSLYRRKPPQAIFEAARTVAEAALAGRTPPRVPGATHYHADYVSPYWAPSLTRIAKIGAHIFYQSPSGQFAEAAWVPAPTDTESAPHRSVPARYGQEDRPAFAPWGLALAAPVSSGSQDATAGQR